MIKTIHKDFRINGLKLFKVKTDSEKEYRCSDCLDLPDVEKIFVEYTIDTPSDDLCELGHILTANVFFQTSNRAVKNVRGNFQLKARVKSDDGDIHFVLYKLKLTANKYFPYYEVGGTGYYTKHVFDKSIKLLDIDIFHNTIIEIKATNHRRKDD